MLKLYANENFPLETVQFLRNLGYDVLTEKKKSFQRLFERIFKYIKVPTKAARVNAL